MSESLWEVSPVRFMILFLLTMWLIYLTFREVRLLRQLSRALRDPDNNLTDDSPSCSPTAFVSIIIPARNEEENITACVGAALAQDHPNLEVIVLEDGSTDRTAEILAAIHDPRLRVISGGEGAVPSGWLGKSWACHRAIQSARGDWFLLTDADVQLGPRAVSVTVGYAERRGLGFMSGFGTELASSLTEKILHAYIFFWTAVETDWQAVNDEDRRDTARGNARFLLLSHDAYRAVGGHQSVRAFLAEDEAIAVRAKHVGVRYRFCFFPTLYRCRMYRSARELWAGWRRLMFQALTFGLPEQHSPSALEVLKNMGLASVMILAFWVLPYVVATLAVARTVPAWLGLVAVFPIIVRQLNRIRFDRRVGFDAVIGACTHWFANLLFLVLFADAVRSGLAGKNQWKGRPLPH